VYSIQQSALLRVEGARMGRQLQKKKNKAKVPKVLTKRKRKTLKNGNKKINVLGNAIIAANW